MRKNQSQLARLLFERMEISFMSRSSSGYKVKIYPWLAILFLVCWVLFSVYCLFIAARYIDYGITKADNKIMKTKFALIAEEVASNRKYLKMARNTDLEMRKMLGMQAGKHVNLPAGIEQAQEERGLNFKDIFTKKSDDIDEQEMLSYLKETTELAQDRLASFQEIAWFYANQRDIKDATPSIRPTDKTRITSGFGYRLSPFGTHVAAYHYGLDFAGKPGAKIYVTADGVVRQTGWAQGYGQTVLVDHGFGYSTLYGHLSDIKVKKGDKVRRGQTIAAMGTTGRSTGVHLHYEVWKDGTPVNPRNYFDNDK